MQEACLVLSLPLLLIVGFILGGCSGSRVVTVPPAITATPGMAFTTPPSVLPSATPAPMPTPPPTESSAPAGESRWQCVPDGGLTCFGGFSYINMLSADEGWAYGAGGTVYHYISEASGSSPTWQLTTPIAETLTALSMVTPTEGWGILEGDIFHYQDGVWQKEQDGHFNDLFMLSSKEGWAVGWLGSISHYQQGQWQAVASPIEATLSSIVMITPEEGWAVGSQGEILRYQNQKWERAFVTDVGLTNNKFFYADFFNIEFVSSKEGWIIGDIILHYQEGAWQLVLENGFQKSLYDMSFVGPNEAWAVGRRGTIFHYHNNQWQEVASPTGNDLTSVDMIDSEEGWAVGANSTMLHYQDGTWKVVAEALPPSILYDIAWLENDTGWAVGPEGILLHYQDGRWQQADKPVYDPDLQFTPLAIDMVSPEEGWAVGYQGVVLHYIEGQWQPVSSPTTENLTDIDMINEQEGWAVGPDAGILHYIDGEWQPAVSAAFSRPVATVMINENEGWAVDLDGAFLHYQNGTWEQIPPIIDDFVTMSDIDMVDEQNGWAVGNHAFRYQDGQWRQVNSPPVGLITVAALNADEVWASGSGIIVHYQNGEWQVVDRPGSFGIRSIKMLNENEGWAVGEGILHYTNK